MVAKSIEPLLPTLSDEQREIIETLAMSTLQRIARTSSIAPCFSPLNISMKLQIMQNHAVVEAAQVLVGDVTKTMTTKDGG